MRHTFKISCAAGFILLGLAALLHSVFTESAFDTCLSDQTRNGSSLQHALDRCGQAGQSPAPQ